VTLQALVMTLDLAMLGASLVCRPAGFSMNPLASAGTRQGRDELNSEAADVSHPLSTREVAILECLMHGDSNKLIARKFQIAEATVKVHIKAILRKIRAANRTQAAIWAMNHLGSSASRKRPEDIATH
jgi:two-component system nitrate/nitrite response regulator NarL